MNAKISVFVICVEAIIYLLLHNFHDSTFKDPFIVNIRFTEAFLFLRSAWNCIYFNL